MASKRKRSNDADEKERDSTRNKRFAYLQPRVRRISERTIKSRWTTLPDSAQAKIRDMLSSLERPVIMRQRNDRKRVGTQAAVQAVVRKYVCIFFMFLLFELKEHGTRIRRGLTCLLPSFS